MNLQDSPTVGAVFNPGDIVDIAIINARVNADCRDDVGFRYLDITYGETNTRLLVSMDGTVTIKYVPPPSGPPKADEHALLTVEEFAFECRIARSTAWELVRTGEIETILVGARSRRIPRQALHEYVDRLRAAAKDSHEEAAS